MSEQVTIKRTVHFKRARKGRRVLREGVEPPPLEEKRPVPHRVRLLAFSIVFEDWLREGRVKDYAELAAVTGLDRSEVSRIMGMRLGDTQSVDGAVKWRH